MLFWGIFTYLLACWLAFSSVALRRGRALAVAACAVVALNYGLWLLVARLTEGIPPYSTLRQVQVAVILAHGLTIALIPSGLARQVRSRRWAPFLALGLAIVWPLLGQFAVALLGRPVPVVSEGWGHLSELLFLDPGQMGEGVTHEGLIPFRFRIHHVAMHSMALLGLLLHLLPIRRQPDARNQQS